jgi:hypothetical protein
LIALLQFKPFEEDFLIQNSLCEEGAHLDTHLLPETASTFAPEEKGG